MDAVASLAGKRVLFVAPRFFGYDGDIAGEIERRGASVTRLFDRPFDKPFMTAVTKVAPDIIAHAALPLYRKLIEKEEAFDIIFVVNGQTLSRTFLDELRAHSPRAVFILYLWDALSNRSSLVPLLGKYDHILGFDRIDARKYGFFYRPLFFVSEFRIDSEEKFNYDISFIGTAHTDRAEIVHKIDQNISDDIKRFWYLFLQARWVRQYYYFRNREFRQIPSDIFQYNSISKDMIAEIFRQSRAILDIEHPLQKGLTMRTFETVGAGKKLITTNPHVIEEDFYDPNNILIVDRKNIEIKRDFFNQPYSPLDPAIYSRYSLKGWLDEILVFADLH